MNTRVIWVKVNPNDDKELQFSNDRTNWYADSDFTTIVSVNDTVIWQLTEYNPNGKIQKDVDDNHKKIFSEHIKLDNGSFVAVVKSNVEGVNFRYRLKAKINNKKYNHDPVIKINA
ncbi:hypothetical protein [Flammeovirga pacifica]|uniref:Proteinase inhibitor I42 chagasin domain-containing protein n=1 Tax=Flammeovirga pacifica TaxID=915059 RepID=A0A1S1YSI0_FLAPC|nr:hypothetical protein [Flammeovirga pacifica]OHX63979.1 hypothetical protein NH26_20425 [Flammeovirga pacifica]